MSILKNIKTMISGEKIDPTTLPIKEQLLFYIKSNEKEKFLDFLRQNFTTEEKKTLQKELKRLYRYHNEYQDVDVNGINNWKQRWDELHDDAQEWAYVAALRFYNRRDMRSFWRKYLDSDLTKELFKTNIPGWFAGYIEDEMSGEWSGISFQEVYQYYQNGVIPKPNPENYIRALSNLSNDYKWEEKNKNKSYIYQYLIEHPAIITEDILLFFEYPHNAHNHDNYKENHKQWRSVILRLVKEGQLDAETIAKKNLQALQLGFNRAQDSWQKKMYEVLVTDYDIEQNLQEDLLNLLANSNPQNISFALKRLKAIQKKKQLNDAAFLEAASSLFYQESKTTVKTTIQILTNIAKSDSDKQEAVCVLAADGLMNEDGDIQKRIATLLLKYGAKDKDVLQEMIAPYTPTLHTSAKEVLKDYIIEDHVIEEEYIPQEAISKLDESRSILPVQDIDELLFLGHQVLEQKEESIDIERFFGGFIQFKKEIAKQPERLHPLLDRVKKRADSWSEMSNSSYIIMAFILNYFKEDLKKYTRFNHQNKLQLLGLDGFIPFVEYRVFEVLQNAFCSKPVPLLSAITHAPYWIDPVVLVERMLVYQEVGGQIPRFDFILAMARLAFEKDKIVEAFKKSKSIKGEEGKVLRFLLSGTLDEEIANLSLWLNAARTREPQGDFSSSIARWGLPSTPDLINAPSYDTKISTTVSTYYNSTYTYTNQEIVKSLTLSKQHRVDKKWLYVQLHGNLGWNNQNILLHYVPNNPEALFAANQIQIEAFLEPTLTLLPMAQIRLADYLVVENKVERQIAHEAFIIQAELGKLDYQWIGKQLGSWIPSGYLKMNRLIEGLKFISDTSTFHAKAISHIIRAIVPHFEEKLPRLSKSLLELWYDILSKTGETIDLKNLNPHVEEWLKKGSSKPVLNKIIKLSND